MSSQQNVSRRRRGRAKREAITPFLLILPAMAILVVFKAYPFVNGLIDSLTRKEVFPSIANYERMLTDKVWLEALGNSVKGIALLPVFILVPLVIAFALFTGIRGWRTLSGLWRARTLSGWRSNRVSTRSWRTVSTAARIFS